MMKYTALFFILLCSAMIGSELSERARIRHRNMLGMVKLVRHIRSCIDGFNLPLNEIYKSFDPFLISSAEFMSDLKSSDLYSALLKHESSLPLPDGVISPMKELALRLGKSYTEDQLLHCDRCLKSLEELASIKEKEISGKIRSYYTLCLSGGVAVVLLLL